jgi:hypothetical protein
MGSQATPWLAKSTGASSMTALAARGWAFGVEGEMSSLLEAVAKDWLRQQWRELQDGNIESCLQYVRGAIDALYEMNVLTSDESELWHRRILECPDKGREHLGGRTWCAYCGDLERHNAAIRRVLGLPDDYPHMERKP